MREGLKSTGADSGNPMKTIFKLTAYILCPGDELGDNRSAYPFPIWRDELGYFTDVKRAEAFLREWVMLNETDETKADVVCLLLEEMTVDAALDYVSQRSYDFTGALHGQVEFYPFVELLPPFSGRPPETCRYQEGDLVQVVHRDGRNRLQLGIVAHRPYSPQQVAELQDRAPDRHLDMSDDVYLVYYYDGRRWDHDHPHECMLFRPMFPVTNEQELKASFAAHLALLREEHED